MDVFTLVGKISIEGIDAMNTALDKTGKKLESTGSNMSSFVKEHEKGFTKIGLAMTGMAVGVGGASLKMAGDFDTAMREVNTMMGLGEEEFQAMKDSVLGLSGEVGKAPVEMAKALYQVVSSGAAAGRELEFLGTSARAAIGGVTDTVSAVDGLSTVINAFHMTAADTTKVADLMFQAVKGGKTTFSELSAQMYQAAPAAAQMGMGFDEVMAATAAITKQGVPTAQAMTQIQASLKGLMAPSDTMAGLLEKMGFETGEAAIATLGWQGTMLGLRDAAGDNVAVLTEAFGRVEGLKAMLQVTGESTGLMTEQMIAMSTASDGAGASMGSFEEMNKSAGRQMEMASTQVKVAANEIGANLLPALSKALSGLTPFIKAIGNLAGKCPGLTVALLAITAALGGTFLLLPKLIRSYEALRNLHVISKAKVVGHTIAIVAQKVAMVATTVATGAWTAAQWLLNAALTANPIGLVVAAVAALIAIVVLLVKNWKKISAFFKKLWGTISKLFAKAIDKIKGILKKYGPEILALLFPIVGIPLMIYKYRDKILQVLRNVWDRIKSFVKEWGLFLLGLIFPPALIAGIIIKYKDKILEILSTVWENIKDFLKEWGLFILGIIFPPALIAGVIIKYKDKIVEVLSTVWENIKEFLKDWGLFILGIIFPPALVAGLVLKFKDKILEVLSNVWASIKDFLKDWGLFLLGIIFPPALIAGVIIKYKDVIVDKLKMVKDGIVSVFTSVKDKVVEVFTGMKDKIVDVFKAIPDAFKDAFNRMTGLVRDFSWSYSGWKVMGKTIIPSFTFEPFKGMPQLAAGGEILRAGAAIIGEQGPEILSLPRSAMVAPLPSGAGGGGSRTVEVHVHTQAFMGNEHDAYNFAKLMSKYIEQNQKYGGVW